MLPCEAEFFSSFWTSTTASSKDDCLLRPPRFSSLELREQDEEEDSALGLLR